jgi:hypothetical protein
MTWSGQAIQGGGKRRGDNLPMIAIFRRERWRPPSWRTIGTRLGPLAERSCEYAAAIGTCTTVNNSSAATQLVGHRS